MVSYISASYIYPITSDPVKNGVLVIAKDGTIVNIITKDEADRQNIRDIIHYKGILVPGFVNTHCHLELSHLKGEIRQGGGLIDFVQNIMKLRSSDEHALDIAMLKADFEMFENGIVAVGDISNQMISKPIKLGSPIYYHTFLEIMGFNPATAKQSMERALEFKKQFDPLSVSIVPHAPYSVSAELFEALSQYTKDGEMISIHNQETQDENAFFENKTGDFLELYKFLGLDIDFYKPSGKSSLQTFLPLLSHKHKILLVHNTFTSKADIDFAKAGYPDLYLCLCPNANLYIEDKLPDVLMLIASGVKITLGTDSLASNTGLSIFAEMLTLQNHFNIPASALLKWATWNGAEFLDITGRYGSLEPGKRPGINLIGFAEQDGAIILQNMIKRLF